MHSTKGNQGDVRTRGVLVPVGVKYGALQQTGRTAERGKSSRLTFKEREGRQAITSTHVHRFSQSFIAREASLRDIC